MKGIIYCRVSSVEQVQGTSLENQERACRDYAKNKGIEVGSVFIERGESATAAKRTELIKALDYCKNQKNIIAFIVWKIDRFARNMTDHYALRAQLRKYGTELHSVTEQFSDLGTAGTILEAVLAGYAEFENDVRKLRCEGGIQGRIRDGIWPWQPPIGYIHSKKLHDRKKLLPDDPDPDRFYLIQRALKEYGTGKYTMVQIADLMNKWGFTTRTGKKTCVQRVDEMLSEKFYTGILVDPWSGEEIIGKHKAMITYIEYQQIQIVKTGLSNNAIRLRMDVNPDFPLRGTVLCECKVKYTAGWRQGRHAKYPYYQCHNRACDFYSHGIKKNQLEDNFFAFLSKAQPKQKPLQMFEEFVLESWHDRHQVSKKEYEHYDKELKHLETKKNNILEMRVNGEIEKDDYLKLKDSIDNQLAVLTLSRNEAQIDESSMEEDIHNATNILGNLAEQWRDIEDIWLKQRLQQAVLPEGIMYNKTAGAYYTAALPCIFKVFGEFDRSNSGLVAGAGIAPAPSGYEPDEVLLLHPAC